MTQLTTEQLKYGTRQALNRLRAKPSANISDVINDVLAYLSPTTLAYPDYLRARLQLTEATALALDLEYATQGVAQGVAQ